MQTTLARTIAFADPGKKIAAGIVRHHLFKAGWIAILLVQGRRSVEPVQVADQRQNSGVFFTNCGKGHWWSLD
jgi:hypothetical protein